MLSMPRCYLVSVLVVLLTFTYSDGEQCGQEEFMATAECDRQWGFEMAGEGQVFNIQRLIEFCSQSERPNIDQCARDAYASCDPFWETEEHDRMLEQFTLVEEGIGYLCTKADVLQRDSFCLNRTMPEITQCFRNAQRRLDEENIHQNSNSVFHEALERFGRSMEVGVFNVIESSCGIEPARLFGNLIYGAFVYVYDGDNRGKR